MAKLREAWGYAPSFDLRRLLETWKKAVESIEAGYQFSFYDYTNELAMRDEIEQVKVQVPTRLATEITAYVQPLDHRFQFATRPCEPLLPAIDQPDRYWWSRVPKRLEGQLLDDLMREGIVS